MENTFPRRLGECGADSLGGKAHKHQESMSFSSLNPWAHIIKGIHVTQFFNSKIACKYSYPILKHAECLHVSVETSAIKNSSRVKIKQEQT